MPGPNDQLLDLVFVLDCTGSMGPYIRAAEKSINSITDEISKSSFLAAPDDLHVGLVTYRDDVEIKDWVTNVTPLTKDWDSVKNILKNLTAKGGGGDGPEAVMTALDKAINEIKYRDKAHKVIIQIADAPPHGIGENPDLHPLGDPISLTKYDVFKDLHNLLDQHKINWFVVKCEPEMTIEYDYAETFYDAMTVGYGTTIVLSQGDQLAKAVIGLALESLDLETVLEDLAKDLASGGATPSSGTRSIAPPPSMGLSLLSIAEPDSHVSPADMKKIFTSAKSSAEVQALMKAQKAHPDDALKDVHEYFTAKGTKVTTVRSGLKSHRPEEALHNMKVFQQAKKYSDIQGQLKKHPRIAPTGSDTVDVSSEPISADQVKRLAKKYRQKYRE